MMEQVIAECSEALFRHRPGQGAHGRPCEKKSVGLGNIVFRVVLPAMDLMIKSISAKGEANPAKHFMTDQIADMMTSEMITKFKETPEITGCVVIGTACGDVNSLGKRIVIGGLKPRMVEVKDLGDNVRN